MGVSSISLFLSLSLIEGSLLLKWGKGFIQIVTRLDQIKFIDELRDRQLEGIQIFLKILKLIYKLNRFMQQFAHLQLPINCLIDENHGTRNKGLSEIDKETMKMQGEILLRFFNETKMAANLIKTISDSREKNREISLKIIETLIKKTNQNGKALYEQFLPTLIHRVNETPFPETSENVRLKIVEIFLNLVPHKDSFIKVMPEFSSAIAKCLMDPFDEIKLACCTLINQLSKCLRHQVGKHSTNTVKSLCLNLTHQKFKVRKAGLESLGNLLVTEGAGINFEQAKVLIKARFSDKKKEVREACLECSANLLRYMAPRYLKEHEATLTGFLLMGLEDEELVERTIQLLDECGAQLKQEEGDEMVNEVSS